jgi:hypothetical protein
MDCICTRPVQVLFSLRRSVASNPGSPRVTQDRHCAEPMDYGIARAAGVICRYECDGVSASRI